MLAEPLQECVGVVHTLYLPVMLAHTLVLSYKVDGMLYGNAPSSATLGATLRWLACSGYCVAPHHPGADARAVGGEDGRTLQERMVPKAEKVSRSSLFWMLSSRFLMNKFPTPPLRVAGSRWLHMMRMGLPLI